MSELRQPISTNMPRMVLVDENNQLIYAISPQEIKDTVFLMDPYKAPGSDGFSGDFFF